MDLVQGHQANTIRDFRVGHFLPDGIIRFLELPYISPLFQYQIGRQPIIDPAIHNGNGRVIFKELHGYQKVELQVRIIGHIFDDSTYHHVPVCGCYTSHLQ